MGLGPPIILDKSTLEALSAGEARLLNTYYYSSLAPILITEVLGDLSRPPGSVRRHVADVSAIDELVRWMREVADGAIEEVATSSS